ncbi:MAG: M50 family metallopeptidase [Acidobacteria bacterium]|nr:M50 family metallopeptidase [Acidobacteriota bacterium]
MKYKVAEDAKPQLMLLLIATVITIALWFIPFADYLVYPIRLFVTFVYEGSHVLAALLTGASVQSLTVSSDGSGMVQSLSDNWLSVLLTSSAGYLGTTAFGVALLVLIRRAYSARIVLMTSAAFVGIMTMLFGFFAPLWNIFSADVNLGSIAFTVVSGAILAIGLFAIGRYAPAKWANFALAFLAVQCLLNALSDLTTLFFINAPLVGSHIHTDAGNMSQATGLPAFVWVLLWIGISVLMISVGLRVYAVSQKSKQYDLPFED